MTEAGASREKASRYLVTGMKDSKADIDHGEKEINRIEELVEKPIMSIEQKELLTIQLSNAQVMLKQVLIAHSAPDRRAVSDVVVIEEVAEKTMESFTREENSTGKRKNY